MVPQSIRYGNARIDFSIRFNTILTKTITVSVDERGQVRVAAPEGTNLKKIRNAVRQRARWITKQVDAFHHQQIHTLPRTYVSGETHLYLGKQYLLKVQSDFEVKPSVKLIRGQLVITTQTKDRDEIRKHLGVWYRKHAREMFEKRLAELAPTVPWLNEKALPKIKLLAMKKQWGSCSPHGHIVLNPALVKAPRECIDYVILHEVCHLKEHNHSPRFYRLLSSINPKWEPAKQRLDGMAGTMLNM